MEKFGEVMDVINTMFWVIFGTLGLIGLILRITKKTKSTTKKTVRQKIYHGQNLMSYLENRIMQGLLL